MLVIDLQWALYLFLLLVAAAVLLAVALDRRRFRDPLLVRSGADETQMGQLLDGAPFGLMLLDHDHRCRYGNRTIGDLFSWPARWGPLPDAPWRPELMEDLALAEQEEQARYRSLHLPDGRNLSWWLCPLPRMNLLLVTDQSRQARLERASRAFLGTLSHELRTPLTAILAHMAVVQGEDVAQPVREQSLAVVQQEAERLARLVQDLLQLGRLEMSDGVQRRPLDLVLVAEAAIAEVILAAEKRDIALSLEAEMPLPRVLGDADNLQRVFLNLLDNSIKYGRQGDEVVVRLAPLAEGVQVTIIDSGPGIPSEHLPHVAERLYRARTDVSGSGLGLSVASEILRQHDAALHLTNRKEGGLRATFVLPQAGSRGRAGRHEHSTALSHSHAPSTFP